MKIFFYFLNKVINLKFLPLLFKMSCCINNWSYSSYPIIIMRLILKLYWTYTKGLHHFYYQSSTTFKTKRTEQNFSHHSTIRNHHSHWSEKSLKTIRKLWTSCTTRIHSNKDTERANHFNIWTFKVLDSPQSFCFCSK